MPRHYLERQLRDLRAFRCRRPCRGREPKADREGRDDHSCLRAFDDRNAGRNTMEGVFGYAVKCHERTLMQAVVSKKLGINLSSRKEEESFKWFLACLLFGKPIQQEIAE